jgi:hypothetical protein
MSQWLERARQSKSGTVVAHPRPTAAPVPPPLPMPRPSMPPPPPMPPKGAVLTDWLARVRETALQQSGERKAVARIDEEMLRILGLPMIPADVARCPDREAYAKTLVNHAAPKDFKLRDIQIDGAYTYEMVGGLLAPIGCGHGKTGLTLLCAKIGIQRRGHERVIITVPSEVYSQLIATDIPQARKWLALDGIPFWFVDGSAAHRMQTAQQPGGGVWIYSYSSISTKRGQEELQAINATLWISDEAHFLASPKSARTKRWTSVISGVHKMLMAGKGSPGTKAKGVECVALSGTITKKSIEDYSHMAQWCLGDNSPVPISYTTLSLFSSMIDAEVKGTSLTDLDYERMRRMVQWADLQGCDVYDAAEKAGTHLTTQEATREAFQFRLKSAPGVVATSDAGVDCSLIISWSEPPRPVTPESERLVEVMKAVVEDMKTPDGDTIDFGMHTYKWLWELTTGFYNSLSWPKAEQLQEQGHRKGKDIPLSHAEALLQAAFTHNELLQKYHKELRYFLDRKHNPGCDTPMLVANEILHQAAGKEPRVKLPETLAKAYKAHKDAYYDDLPKRLSRPVRICDYKIKAVVEWAKVYQKEGGLMWYHHPAVGGWVSEYLTAAGIPHTWAEAGQDEKAYAPGLVIASYAHATGKNLQKQSRNLIIELRREADKMEQMLARTHRSGQKADDVRVDVLVSNGFDLALFNAILRDADYAQSTTGMRQRLCYATYAPVVPPANPHLAVRLGIVAPQDAARARMVAAQDTITPVESLSWNDVFRSVTYDTRNLPARK